ncbi:MAG: hypothetical protein R3213_08640, partial [Flavobacteriaceae bacterium]|nr:hypothetical protein [Flavobacteriaceae bacterium]
AVSGSILISDKINDQIRSHQHIQSTYLGAYEFKNVEDPMPLFAISNEGLVVPDREDVRGKLKQQKPKEPSNKLKRKAPILAVFLLILISAVVYFSFYNESPIKERSIAVLPFSNLSTEKDDEILGDGITEEILTSLTKIEDLHVISRTSILKYRNTKKSIPQIARELGVSYILEGSIQKNGNQLRVTAQLIDAKEDKHVWAEKYDRTMKDIFDIQTEVSKEIVDALELNISLEDRSKLVSIPTQNLEAYRYFLRGKQEADQRSKESIERSIDLFNKAIDLDPEFAEAYAEIANSIFLSTYYARANPEEASKRAEIYLNKAEELKPSVARIYTVKGLLYNHSHQYDRAKSAFEKAIALAPNDVTARQQFATYYFYTKQYEKQLEQNKIAYNLDPLSFAAASGYLSALTYNRKYDEAEELLKEIEDKFEDAERSTINRLKMRLYMTTAEYDKAINPLYELTLEDTNYFRMLGYSYAKAGDTMAAYRIIDSLRKYGPEDLRNHRIAVVYAGLGKADSVFWYLDSTRNKSQLFNSDRLAYFDEYKSDKRYQELLAQHKINAQN